MTASNKENDESISSAENSLAMFDMNEIVTGRRLGTGGFCHVFEIKDFKLNVTLDQRLTEPQIQARNALIRNAKTNPDRYVLKVLRKDKCANPKLFRVASKDIATEVSVLSSIRHRNIIQIRGSSFPLGPMESDVSHDRYFLIMDRLSKDLCYRIDRWRPLDKRLSNKGLLGGNGKKQKRFLAERLQAASEIASALDYLHKNRMVYRDLKPSNVGFDADGKACLFDFGLARSLPEEEDELSDTFEMSGKVGTYRFMAPEVSCGSKYNEKADVYGFSHVLYTMLCFQKPYASYGKQEHRMRVARGGERPPLDHRWPKAIQDLLERSWSPNISERPSMAEVNGILQQVISKLLGVPFDNTPVRTDDGVGVTSRPSQVVPIKFSNPLMPRIVNY